MIVPTPLCMQAEWFFYNAGKAANGTPHERQKAISILLDMAHNHEDARIRTRAASIVVSRHWGNVQALTTRPEGGAA